MNFTNNCQMHATPGQFTDESQIFDGINFLKNHNIHEIYCHQKIRLTVVSPAKNFE